MLAAHQLLRRARPLAIIGRAAFSSQSSFFESNPTLFSSKGNAASKVAPGDAELRDNVRTMGSLLGNIIQKRQGKHIFDKVEKLRHLAKVSFTVGKLPGMLFSANMRGILTRAFCPEISDLA